MTGAQTTKYRLERIYFATVAASCAALFPVEPNWPVAIFGLLAIALFGSTFVKQPDGAD